MSGTKLTPEKITSPFQLMAAWFAMLVLVVSVLLTAATQVEKPEWAAGYLVVFSTIVILIVIACVLLMLTKYRPHLQDGKEYAEWIKDQGTYSSGYLRKGGDRNPSKSTNIKRSSSPKLSTIKDISVSVKNAVGSQEIIETLKNKGYNVELYNPRFKENEEILDIKGCSESIWIGERVSPEVAIKAIKLALVTWPELKYVHITSDRGDPPDYVNDQIFIGGSTQSAVGKGTQPWKIEELKSLDPHMDIKDFHAAIRQKYS